MRPKMMVGALCLVSVAALAACQPAQPLDAAAKSEPLTLEATPAQKTPAAKAASKKVVAKSDATPAVSNAVAANVKPSATPAVESRGVEAKQHDEDAPIATTVTGCLELRDDGMFQLKDTDGQHAPKSRSWKSGFIKKGAAKVDVFDAGNRLQLGTHVGYRVSISGTLLDRELRARSLRATTDACK